MFSTSLAALQLHIRTLLEGVGGDQLTKVLDLVAELGVKEQTIVLKLFEKVVSEVLAGDTRYLTEDDNASRALVDSMCKDVLTELSRPKISRQPRLTVLDGRSRTKVRGPYPSLV